MRYRYHRGACSRLAIAALFSVELSIAGPGASAGIGPAAMPGPIQSYNTYKSWFVACDNELACVAKGVSDGADITIERQGGPTGTLVAFIRADHAFGLADIKTDGQPAGLSRAAWQLSVADDETTATSSDLVAIRSLVQRLRNASKVSLGGDSEVPLDGFAAAMLRLDERQGRLGGVTALFRPGPAPASQVPARPPIPKIPNHPITATLQKGEEARLIAGVRADQRALFDTESCEKDPTAMEPEAHALDAGQALVLIPCMMGAYQGSSLAFIAPRGGGHARRLIAPTPYLGSDPDHPDGGYFTESAFDPGTGTLSVHAKGRGLGDCGMSASWIWDGKAFRLSEMSLQQACGGVAPGDWPSLFRSSR
jgi:hypothetical protein